MKKKINAFFENFIKKESIFLDKEFLQPGYLPEEVSFREEQIEEVANILAPALRKEKPSNLFILGKTGTGKTLTIKHITQSMEEIAKDNNLPLKIIYINCKLKKVADTEYRLIAQLIREFGMEIPATGLPTDEVYTIFYKLLKKENRFLVLILDEIDQLTGKTGDGILYNLTRINAESKAQLSLVGISNNLVFAENLDPRIKSSLSEEEVHFPSYNAIQIQTILRNRAEKAFRKETLKSGVIEKCAALAAQEHGDARRAIDLLRIAGEIAERRNSLSIELAHLDEAREKVEYDSVVNSLINYPKQFQVTLYAIFLIAAKKRIFFTGEMYEVYKKLCAQLNLSPLTQRRISDIVSELDMLGIINAKIISKGRYGRTREISMSLAEDLSHKIKATMEKELHLGGR